MNNNFSNPGKPRPAVWGQLGARLQAGLTVATFLGVAGLMAMALWSGRADSRRLSCGLSEAESAKISAALNALAAERVRLDVISQNIANAHTARYVDGKPYQRRVVVVERNRNETVKDGNIFLPGSGLVKVMRDARPLINIYAPGDPDADAQGMVATPNVNISEEMADMKSVANAMAADLALIKETLIAKDN